MPSKSYSFVSREDAERYYDAVESADYHRRRQTHTYTTTDPWEYQEAKDAFFGGRATTLGGVYGMVIEITPPQPTIGGDQFAYSIVMRPIQPSRSDLEAISREKLDRLAEMMALPWDHPMCRCNMEALLTLEDGMKIFETIVVNVNEQGEITGVAQDVKLVIAKTAQAAKDQVLVDYSAANGLTGKDLTGFQVRTREFLGA